MKIAVVASGHVPSTWAHSINTVKHAAGFQLNGHSVTLHAPLRLKEFFLMKSLRSLAEWYGTDDLDFRSRIDFPGFIKDFGPFAYLNSVFSDGQSSSPWVERAIARDILAGGPELVYCRSWYSALDLIEAGAPVVIESHNEDLAGLPILKRLLAIINRPNFLGLITCHEAIQERQVEAGIPREKTLVLPSAVDYRRFVPLLGKRESLRQRLNLPQKKRIVLYCGSLRPGKGIKTFLDTALSFRARDSVAFIVAGGPEQHIAAWKKYARSNNIPVEFLGFIRGFLVPSYLIAADLLFMPYDVDEKRTVMKHGSTSPLKLFEYFASGNPTLTTAIPAFAGLLEDGRECFLCPSDNPNYPEAIDSILFGSRKLSVVPVVRRALQIAQQNSYEKRCEAILGLATGSKNTCPTRCS